MTEVPLSPDQSDRSRHAARELAASIYELSGGSMSPTLELGWKVLVAPSNGPPRPGDVILIECRDGHVIHRCLGQRQWGTPPEAHVVHSGDVPGALVGLAPMARVKGVVSAVVSPEGRRLPALAELPRRMRRRLERLPARWTAYSRLSGLAGRLPGLKRLVSGAPSRAIRNALGLG